MLTDRLLRDPWLQALAVGGAVLLAVHAIAGLPWVLWVAWAYLVALSVVEVTTDLRQHTATWRDVRTSPVES